MSFSGTLNPEHKKIYEVLFNLTEEDFMSLARPAGIVIGRGKDLDVRSLIVAFYGGIHRVYEPRPIRFESED